LATSPDDPATKVPNQTYVAYSTPVPPDAPVEPNATEPIKPADLPAEPTKPNKPLPKCGPREMFKDGACVFCDDYLAKTPDETDCIKLDCKYN
jgi:hypothetical protein